MNYNYHMARFISRLFIIVTGLACMTGCKGGEKSVEMGPVETVEAFCKSISIGQWDKATALCDTVSMKEYIESYKDLWDGLEQENEGAMKVTKSIMEKATVTVNDVHKADNKRIVTYTLEADGLSKTNKATLEKVEGAWRVSRITEEN